MITILQKKTKAVFEISKYPDKIIVPSKKFPLENTPYEVFSAENTEDVRDEKVIRIFDSIIPEVGRCFSNAKSLCDALNREGYAAKQYVGWLFLDDELPVHHSFVILGNHLLDVSVDFKKKDIDFLDSIKTNDSRKKVAEYMRENRERPNHERCNFGKCDEMYHYCAAPGTAEQGINRNQQLRSEYPNHPSFADVGKDGKTKMQRDYPL